MLLFRLLHCASVIQKVVFNIERLHFGPSFWLKIRPWYGIELLWKSPVLDRIASMQKETYA
jgi:hypothetical protein